RRWVDDAADGALRTDRVPLPVVGIDTPQPCMLEAFGKAPDIPPRHPVLPGHDRRPGSKQRRQLLRHLPCVGVLWADDHKILAAETSRIVRRFRPAMVPLAIAQ